uniref:Integrator complex subunit 7 N-terminal domain-containing protein n=1 Tax=Fagus sylvatica TaxID=28930 RepID=A0A2N9HEE1_FAGSY
MERNSTACAMEWSIELEKALRSKKPGQPVEAILQIGPRLEHWSREPEPSMVVNDMFGLVPGEDRLFANTILLRLADAFRIGDKDTKLAVVKIFLSEYRHRNKRKKSNGNKGILSKARVQNHLELLTRVKVVFDTGDVESKALALALFGCWADFAKDSAQIRYLILSSVVSSHVLEVKASLFAAGCFSELSDDFACIVLEMLVNMLTASETSSAVRLAGARVLAKIGCSYSVANRAYKLDDRHDAYMCRSACLLYLDAVKLSSFEVLPYMSPQLPCLDIPEFAKLLTIAENSSQSPIMLNGFLSIHVLVDISRKLRGNMEMESGIFGSSLPSRNIQIWVLWCWIKLAIYLLKMLQICMDHVMATRQSDTPGHEMVDLQREKSRVNRSKLVFVVYRFVVACLESLNEAGAATTVVFEKETCGLSGNSVNYHLIEKEILTLECANKMLKERYNWPAYRAGMYAACQGAWFTVTFIFQQLMTKVQSDICCSWLKSIIQLGHSERKIQLLLLPKQGSTLVDWLEKNKFPASDDTGEISRDAAGSSNQPNYSEELDGAYRGICSSGKTLESAVSSVLVSYFLLQILLPVKLLQLVVWETLNTVHMKC